jgi:hypothetical protein
MEVRRRWLVYGLVTVMVGGHLYDLVTDREHWPFSQYPMYAHAAREWSMLLPRLVGVRSDGGGEVELWETRYLEPFDQSRLLQALQTILQEPDGRSRATAALADCLARYERRRRDGAHDGPALAGIRLYHVLWTLEPTAANVDHPDRRDLVLDVRQP